LIFRSSTPTTTSSASVITACAASMLPTGSATRASNPPSPWLAASIAGRSRSIPRFRATDLLAPVACLFRGEAFSDRRANSLIQDLGVRRLPAHVILRPGVWLKDLSFNASAYLKEVTTNAQHQNHLLPEAHLNHLPQSKRSLART